ncbi:hypothetical protein VOF76_27150, partial [Leclercia adecarboxylata]
ERLHRFSNDDRPLHEMLSLLIPLFSAANCAAIFLTRKMKMNDLTIVVLSLIAADLAKTIIQVVFGDANE